MGQVTVYRCDQCMATEDPVDTGIGLSTAPHRWIRVTSRDDGHNSLEFCSWNCVAVYAADQDRRNP
jgi:hypothetical protein